ncbi:HNH endonuclease [Echinicola vietnamensis]|uniref:HNH nuclease domain-containing protein n=1 Tax=Echinicola vietnamensis (strain DSM 17526 / LMG 23754 / KMM 6221) TaxID=926556 RepID=L0FTQ8_ECHVK|nr:HNH endonuclease [Echinicola vietnamensis]AGA77299.1 hypothetical protein Echvi_1028 [Echinicola vietnamensis DSM 17526]
MQKGQRLWSREELILAINLYCKLPFGKIHTRNQDVINLAKLINRTPGSVAYKLVNFASLDPSLQARGIKGAYNTSKLDRAVWEDFYQNWEEAAYQSEILLDKYRNGLSIQNQENTASLKEGKDQSILSKTRINQHFFRNTILASYNNTCCITGIQEKELLIAGHILPWSQSKENRLNPRNGLLINNLHDKAFENGLFTITPDYRIVVSNRLRLSKSSAIKSFFLTYHDKQIILPSKFLPDPEFLKYHNKERFRE